MRTLKGIITFTILLTLLQGCMPDSLTKFKEESVKKVSEAGEGNTSPTDDDDDKTFYDSEGNEINPDLLVPPTGLNYATTTFASGGKEKLYPGTQVNDLYPQSDGTLRDNVYENYLNSYAFTSACTGYSIDSKTGIITPDDITTPSSPVSCNVSLSFTNPKTSEVETGTAIVTLSIQTAIPSDFHFYDSTNAFVRLQLANTSAFAPSGNITSDSGSSAIVSSIDSNRNVYLTTGSPSFKIGDKVDNNTPYIVNETTITAVNFYYPTTATTIAIGPISTSKPTSISNADNAVVYSISPALPTFLSLDSTTGIISNTGTISQIDREDYTITVSNDNYSRSYTFGIAFVQAPEMLAYSNLKAVEVDDATRFQVGDNITSSPKAPFTTYGSGIVKKIVNTNVLIVEVGINSDFQIGQFVDNSDSFISAETEITATPKALNTIVTMSNPSDFTVDTYACQMTNLAKAIVTKKAASEVFLMQSYQTGYSNYFNQGASIYPSMDDCATASASTGSATAVWSPVMTATLADSTNFTKGQDIITSVGASGYITYMNGSDIDVEVYTPQSLYITNGINFEKPYSATTTINDVKAKLMFNLEVGKGVTINSYTLNGGDLVYSITPTLPEGLTLNTSTGNISGSPTKTYPSTIYTVTASNVIGSSSTSFQLKVNDFFEVKNVTEEASSYILHKSGQAGNNRRCRINKEEILNSSTASDIIDIDCMLEGAESDLFNLGAKLQAYSGKSICEYISYTPYTFYVNKPIAPAPTRKVYNQVINFACTAYGTTPSLEPFTDSWLEGEDTPRTPTTTFPDLDLNNLCAYDQDADFNCDERSFEIARWNIQEGPNAGVDCEFIKSVSIVNCGGERANCKNGPIRDTLSDNDILTGKTGTIFSTYNGSGRNFTISSPISKGYSTNIYIANFTSKNSCYDSSPSTVIYSNGWSDYAEEALEIDYDTFNSPFRGGSPYYEFSCLDSAFDIKARIRLNIRDWDRTFNKSSAIDSFLAASPMDDITTNPLDGDSFDQIRDWDSFSAMNPTYSFCSDSSPPSTSNTVLTGTLNIATREITVIGTGTLFTVQVAPGDVISFGSVSNAIVKSVISDTELILTEPYTGSATSGAGTRNNASFPFPGDDGI